MKHPFHSHQQNRMPVVSQHLLGDELAHKPMRKNSLHAGPTVNRHAGNDVKLAILGHVTTIHALLVQRSRCNSNAVRTDDVVVLSNWRRKLEYFTSQKTAILRCEHLCADVFMPRITIRKEFCKTCHQTVICTCQNHAGADCKIQPAKIWVLKHILLLLLQLLHHLVRSLRRECWGEKP